MSPQVEFTSRSNIDKTSLLKLNSDNLALEIFGVISSFSDEYEK